ncbi:hypothetical protein CYLTODRAFT_377085 [Cylindrobasidium torrendii FP15055 ss-10]|uniref:Nucleolar protein 12 n=1 Tax=Cylindrobasidium torrendii FP15055 ss-10 TaxID=1314674 RepID=A0A0D7B8U6_9AGAR|nr:hypothetical protein CYLTODRAFT_377085 [Cylindrobasidium torrendii FP15055 ss-10]
MSNLSFLTKSHGAIAAKKKAKRNQIKEIIFDDEARREFLTGFHKRKLAKAEAARKKAQERDKAEHLETRREARRALREQAAENAAMVEQAYGAQDLDNDDQDDEWSGVSKSPREKQAEYQDEEILATVAVVEDFDPDTLIHGPPTVPHPSDSSAHPPNPPPKTTNTSQPGPKKAPKPAAKKFRYESKAARKVDRTKQRARKLEKAERAGGKGSRKSKNTKQKGRH